MSLIETNHDYEEQESDNRLSNYPLMGPTGFKIIIISIIYLIFVKKLGPKLMESRKPFELNRLMQIYNIIQVFLNLCLSLNILHYLIHDNQHNYLCDMPDYSKSERGYREAHISYYYYLLKVLDLIDTIFITLRKRYRQASILHVYHHVVMCIASQFLSQHYPGAIFLIPFMFNSFVHVIMYSYYLLTSIKPEIKMFSWWKKYITQIQMIQFIYNIGHFIRVTLNVNCKYSKFWSIFGLSQNLIFFILFGNFYMNNYIFSKTVVKDKKK